MSEQFDEVLVDRLASTALRTWYNANQPIAPSAWERIIKAVLAELSKTHAILPVAEYVRLIEIRDAASEMMAAFRQDMELKIVLDTLNELLPEEAPHV
jgi:ATP-dependent phosphoenolpyruvate carboxykinase